MVTLLMSRSPSTRAIAGVIASVVVDVHVCQGYVAVGRRDTATKTEGGGRCAGMTLFAVFPVISTLSTMRVALAVEVPKQLMPPPDPS